MKVNCTKFDLCVCGCERQDHNYHVDNFGKIIPNTKKKCLKCKCEEFVYKD